MNENVLRSAYARMLSQRTEHGPECVDPEALLAVLEGTCGEAERLRVMRHVGSCGACKADLDLLRTVRDTVAASAAEPWWRQTRMLAAAAALFVFVGGALLWQVMRPPVVDAPRSAGASGVVLHAPPNGDAVGRPVQLSWEAQSGVRRYEIEVLGADGSVLFAAATIDTMLTVPAAVPLEVGVDYRWWVAAVFPGETRRSLVHRFRIKP